MCEKYPSHLCTCTDYLLPKYELCHPFMCHNASICKLRRLLDEKMSEDCYDQHTFLLFDYIKFCKCGFYITDLLHLSRVLEVLAEKVDTKQIYRPYFKKLLDIAGLPPVIHNCSEVLSEMDNFTEYMSVLGFLGIWLPDIKLRVRAYKSIMLLLTTKEATVATTKLSLRLECVEKSHLPEIMTQLIELGTNAEFYDILNVALMLTKISPKICQKMALVNAVDYLLLRLLPNQENIGPGIIENITHSEDYLKIFHISSQILINIVSNIKDLDEESLRKVTPSANSMWAIRYIFRGLILGKYSQVARNSLMSFIMLCLSTFPYIDITECHLLDDIALLSVATEVDSDTWVQEIKFTNSEYDIAFKKMLVLTLSYARKYPNFCLIFEYRNVIPGLIKIIASEHITDWSDWHSEEHETLIQYTLLSLYYLAPQLIDVFVENDGIQNLMIILETYYLLQNDCNRFKLEETLNILGKLAESKNEKIIDAIRFHSGISVLNLLCDSILGKDIIGASDQEMLSYSFHILSFLYGKPIINDPTLGLLIKYFSRVVDQSSSDTCVNPRTLISALYVLWEIILISNARLREFIKLEGIYLLLDIIDTKSFPVKVVGLGCLTDICEDAFCVPFLLTWRGGEDRKRIFPSLLANVFRDECKKIETRLNTNDIIIDIHYPLMGKAQYLDIMSEYKDCHSSASIADMIGSSRPKVYALLQLLNTRYEENVELTNEHYKISNIPIPRKDKVILHLAQNFFALKLSETWNELSVDLSFSNIEPIEIDAHMLTIIIDQMQKWNESVKSEQESILESEIQKEVSQEMKLYDTLRKCRLQDAIEAVRELKRIARTTDRMFRIAHKEKQKQEIEKTLMGVVDIDKIERTYKDKLIMTAVIPQQYNMQWNRKKPVIVVDTSNSKKNHTMVITGQ